MASHRMISLLLVGLIFAANLHLSGAQIGLCYGGKGNNLPAGKDVVGLFKSNNISRVRLMEPNKGILEALRGTNIEVLLDLPMSEFNPLWFDASLSDKWIATNVKPYVPDVKIKYIVLGTDMSGNNMNNNNIIVRNVISERILKALEKYGLKDIKLTIACDPSMLMAFEANPAPSTVKLLEESKDMIGNQTLPFLNKIGAPLLVNIYPYFEVVKYQSEVKPEFAMFTSTENVITDGKLHYQNKFDAMLDSFYTILEQLKLTNIEIMVGQTGWPSAGGVAATVENEKTYITNLVQHVKKGTPKRPNKPIPVYIDMFDENLLGPQVEKHLGVFTSDGKLKFPVTFNPSA